MVAKLFMRDNYEGKLSGPNQKQKKVFIPIKPDTVFQVQYTVCTVTFLQCSTHWLTVDKKTTAANG